MNVKAWFVTWSHKLVHFLTVQAPFAWCRKLVKFLHSKLVHTISQISEVFLFYFFEFQAWCCKLLKFLHSKLVHKISQISEVLFFFFLVHSKLFHMISQIIQVFLAHWTSLFFTCMNDLTKVKGFFGTLLIVIAGCIPCTQIYSTDPGVGWQISSKNVEPRVVLGCAFKTGERCMGAYWLSSWAWWGVGRGHTQRTKNEPKAAHCSYSNGLHSTQACRPLSSHCCWACQVLQKMSLAQKLLNLVLVSKHVQWGWCTVWGAAHSKRGVWALEKRVYLYDTMGLVVLNQALEGIGSRRENKDLLGRRRAIWRKTSTGANHESFSWSLQ